MRIAIKTLMIFFLLMIVASNVWAGERVLTVYFHGTGFKLDEPFLGLDWSEFSGASMPNVITTLYNSTGSIPIKSKEYNANLLSPDYGKWVPEPITTEGAQYKFNVNGAGTSATSNVLEVLRDYLAEILGKIDPNNIFVRSWGKINDEAMEALIQVNKKHVEDDVILNLVGFSRGGVSALKFAHSAAEKAWVKKINILAYDPVPGGFNPAENHQRYFKLDSKVNAYVGIYAENERSYMFEPIIPTATSFNTRILTVRVPGSHETMVGNAQTDGHATSLNYEYSLDDGVDLSIVSSVSLVIAERLLRSNEWGNVQLARHGTKITQSSPVDTPEEFTSLVEAMKSPALEDLYDGMEGTSFTILKSYADSCFHGLKSYELRSLIGTDLDTRLVFKGGHYGEPWWQWGNCWPLPVLFVSSERVFELNKEVNEVEPDTWKHLQALREPRPAPIPWFAALDKDSLPTLTDQCSVSVFDRPTVTAWFAENMLQLETIEGITVDPLEYQEQGTYLVEWKWKTFLPPFQIVQTQMIEVEDTIPPQPNTLFLPTVTGVGSAEVTAVPMAEDNCLGTITGITFDPLTYAAAGPHEVTWHYEDARGNANTQIQKVIVYPTINTDLASVGHCMRECVQTVNDSTHDKWGNDISVDEFILDCVNYCKPNLKEGYCSPEMDGCCNVIYKETDWDCWALAGEACTETTDCANGLECFVGTCEAPLENLVFGQNCRPGLDRCQADYTCQQNLDKAIETNQPDPNYYCID